MIKISVLTPSYNSVKYIERAIKSVLDQKYFDFEHIIVDGGSTDGTIEILKKYKHLKWISEKDKGQSDAMNKAFIISSGEIIAYLNADDYYENGLFNVISEYFSSNPKCEMLVGIIQVHLNNNTVVNSSHYLFNYEKIRLHYIYGFPNNPVGYFYRRTVQQQIGLFPIDNHYTMDYWFLLKAYKKFSIHHINHLFGHYIFTGFNKTSKVNAIKECKRTYIKYAFKEDLNGLFIYFYNFYKFLASKYIKYLLFKIKN